MYEEDNIESDFLKRQKRNPFQAPEQYFETLEEKIMEKVKNESAPKSRTPGIIKFLKPALGIAASITLVYFLLQAPISSKIFTNTSQTNNQDSSGTNNSEEYSYIVSSTDENTLINAILSGETNEKETINQDEVLAYLSTGLNDVEIYSEIQN